MWSVKLVKQLFFFACVGLTATAVHYFSALAAVTQTPLSVYWSNLLGYVLAVGVSLLGHSFFTFKTPLTISVAKRFVVVSIFTFLLSLFILWLAEDFFLLPHWLSLGVVVFCIPVITFLLSKLWVFAPRT